MRAGPPLPAAPGTTQGFIGSRPSRCSFLRASLRAWHPELASSQACSDFFLWQPR